jgi:hypothetical protein
MLYGVLSPIVYIVTVILGGFLTTGYNHISQAVSDLIAAGASSKALLDPLFAIYNLLTFAFGIGLFLLVRSEDQNQRKLAGTLGALSLTAEGVFGFLTLFFPEDAGGLTTAISATGTMHIVFASLSSLTTMLTILLMGFWFRGSPRMHKYGLYSYITLGVVFITGGLAAMNIATGGPIGGLMERITIGGFLQWLFVVALRFLSREDLNPPPPKV